MKDCEPAGPLIAIILAAGTSLRMGTPKALLPLGNQTVIERIIRTYLLAGVTDIRVVTGSDRKQVKEAFRHLPAREVHNPRYREGMYSSVRCGLASCDPEISGYLIHPVDIPLVTPETIRLLCAAARHAQDRIVCPVYREKRGHPLGVGSWFRTGILEQDSPLGLKGLLYEYAYAIVPVRVDDPFILQNMNTPADYQEVLRSMDNAAGEYQEVGV